MWSMDLSRCAKGVPASQAVKTGSNPVGDAKLNQALADICCKCLLFLFFLKLALRKGEAGTVAH